MNKKIRAIIFSLILLVIVGINISYAISSSNMSSFFEVNKTEVTKDETLEMIIDLSKIDYNQFEFTLNSNVEIEKIYTDEKETNKNDIELNKESNGVNIDIDKEKLNLSKIILYYQIPENIEVGTKIVLNAQIKVKNDVVKNQEKNEVENQVADSKEENWTIVDTKQVEITIIEKDTDNKDDKNKEDNKKEDNKNEENRNQENNINNKQQDNKQNENASKNNSQNENIQEKTISNTSGVKNTSNNGESTKGTNEQADAATYNGSNNNYLTSLEIESAQLTTDFNKEKSTYFATVENIEEIIVTANAEDSSSKVVITGTNLKNGENKVLISVTAENGDVRYYRIYVTKN